MNADKRRWKRPGQVRQLPIWCSTALVAMFAAPVTYAYQPKATRALVQLSSIEATVEEFRARQGRLPTEGEGLQIILDEICKSSAASQPISNSKYPITVTYLWPCSEDRSVPLDPWGHPYAYVVRTEQGRPTYGIYSCGPDGISRSHGDDPDDVNSWKGIMPLAVEKPISIGTKMIPLAIIVPLIPILLLWRRSRKTRDLGLK